jgi:hypothetical protein
LTVFMPLIASSATRALNSLPKCRRFAITLTPTRT